MHLSYLLISLPPYLLMNNVALLIGGNQSLRRSRPEGATYLSRHALIAQATELIQQRIGSVVAASRVYETEPWGEFDTPQQDFLNQGLLVETAMTAHEVLHEALAIEAELGRKRKAGSKLYSSRPMDIDLIFYNDEVIESAELTIPHPRMHLRQFVLEPLAEIMPDYRHPVLGLTVREMMAGIDYPSTPCGGSKNNMGTPQHTGVDTPAYEPVTPAGFTTARQGAGAQAGVQRSGTPASQHTTNNKQEPPKGVIGAQAGVTTPAK